MNNERYEWWKGTSEIIDNKTKEFITLGCPDLLNQQSQRIAELEEQLKNAIVPKFKRQEHICSFAFGEIREYIVVAYLDNNITLCENIETSELEWCDNNFLVRTFEEAQAKLEELKGK
jgi:hypothetical protein